MPIRPHSKKQRDNSSSSLSTDQAEGSHSQAQASAAGSGAGGGAAPGGKHWQSIRPWRPPEGVLESDAAEPSKLQVEVIDIASTAVALAFFASEAAAQSSTPAPPEASAQDTQQQQQQESSSVPSHQQEQPSAAAHQAAISTSSSLTVKLNSNPWPHVFHSDPAFFQDVDLAGENNVLQSQHGATTIVIYGLGPGTSYQIELEWVAQPEADGFTPADEEASPSPLSTRPIVISTHSSSGTSSPSHNHDSFYGPPPPYSSHDPSTPETTSPALPAGNAAAAASPPTTLLQLRTTEAELKSNLAALKDRVKQTESNLHAPLASLKRSFEKSAKEDQRARQRISTLEEATRKLRLLAAEKAELADALVADEVDPLQTEAAELNAQLEARRAQVHKIESEAKKGMREDEEAVKELESELEESDHRVEGLTAERERYEREVIPDLTHRVEALAEQLRAMEQGEYQQEQFQQQQMAAAAAASWYNFAQQSNSSTSLHAFPGANPMAGAVYSSSQPTPSTSRWPSMRSQRGAAPLRSAPSDSVAAGSSDWPARQLRSRVSSRADAPVEARDQRPIVPGLLPRFSSDPTQMTSHAASSSPVSSPGAVAPAMAATTSTTTGSPSPAPSIAVDAAAALAPATSSAGSRFLSGFRKRSFSTQQPPRSTAPSISSEDVVAPSEDPLGLSEEQGGKKTKDDGMLSGLGSKLTRPSSSDSQSSSHTAKMSWSRVVGGKGRAAASGQS